MGRRLAACAAFIPLADGALHPRSGWIHLPGSKPSVGSCRTLESAPLVSIADVTTAAMNERVYSAPSIGTDLLGVRGSGTPPCLGAAGSVISLPGQKRAHG